MGQGFSAISRHVLEAQPSDWEEYIHSEWRSKRARELDNLGGLSRQPIKLGSSFTYRSTQLGATLARQGEALARMFPAASAVPGVVNVMGGPAPNPAGKVEGMSADQRRTALLERKLSLGRRAASETGYTPTPSTPTDAPTSILSPAPPPVPRVSQSPHTPVTGTPPSPGARTGSAARARLLSSQGARSPSPSTGGATLPQPQPPASDMPSQGSAVPGAVSAGGAAQADGAPSQGVAEWRAHVHAARRRTALAVRVALLFKRGWYDKHVDRPPRQEDYLGLMALRALGGDLPRFVAELGRYRAAQVALEGALVALEDATGSERAAGSTPHSAGGTTQDMDGGSQSPAPGRSTGGGQKLVPRAMPQPVLRSGEHARPATRPTPLTPQPPKASPTTLRSAANNMLATVLARRSSEPGHAPLPPTSPGGPAPSSNDFPFAGRAGPSPTAPAPLSIQVADTSSEEGGEAGSEDESEEEQVADRGSTPTGASAAAASGTHIGLAGKIGPGLVGSTTTAAGLPGSMAGSEAGDDAGSLKKKKKLRRKKKGAGTDKEGKEGTPKRGRRSSTSDTQCLSSTTGRRASDAGFMSLTGGLTRAGSLMRTSPIGPPPTTPTGRRRSSGMGEGEGTPTSNLPRFMQQTTSSRAFIEAPVGRAKERLARVSEATPSAGDLLTRIHGMMAKRTELRPTTALLRERGESAPGGPPPDGTSEGGAGDAGGRVSVGGAPPTAAATPLEPAPVPAAISAAAMAGWVEAPKPNVGTARTGVLARAFGLADKLGASIDTTTDSPLIPGITPSPLRTSSGGSVLGGGTWPGSSSTAQALSHSALTGGAGALPESPMTPATAVLAGAMGFGAANAGAGGVGADADASPEGGAQLGEVDVEEQRGREAEEAEEQARQKRQQKDEEEAALAGLLAWAPPTSALATRPRRTLRAAAEAVSGVQSAVQAFLAAGVARRAAAQGTGDARVAAQVEHLEGRIADEEEAAEACLKLLNVYLARANAAWAEAAAGGFTHARAWGQVDETWARSAEGGRARMEVLSALGLGQVALQLICGEDSVSASDAASLPAGTPPPDIWTSDPWALLTALRPGSLPLADRVERVSLCGRVLVATAAALRAVAGSEAVAALPVIMHVHEGQVDEVVEELWGRGFYGLNRTRFLLLVARRHPGYRYDSEGQEFIEGAEALSARDAAARVTRGSGFCAAQLAWAGEALTFEADGTTAVLQVSAFEHLERQGVKWMVSRRARDLGLLNPAATGAWCDVNHLCWCIALSDAAGGRPIMEVVDGIEEPSAARGLDSEVVGLTGPAWASGPGLAEGSTVFSRMLPAAMLPPPASAFPVVCELRASETSSATVRKHLEVLKGTRAGEDKQAGAATPAAHGTVMRGVGSYFFNLASLKAALSRPLPLRPRLALSGPGLVSVTLDVGDVGRSTNVPGFIALKARRSATMLLGLPGGVEALLTAVKAQDADPVFRNNLPSLEDMRAQDRASNSGTHPSGPLNINLERSAAGAIIVFVVRNTVSPVAAGLAARFAKPERDKLYIVTAVPSDTEVRQGEADVAPAVKVASDSGYGLNASQIITQVLIRGAGAGLLDVMEKYVRGIAGEYPGPGRVLVVLGSTQLTSSDFSHVVGSVALGAAKRFRALGLPVVLTTANAKQAPGPTDPLRTMALVAPWGVGIMRLVGSRLMDQNLRSDRLVLLTALTSSNITRAAQATAAAALNDYVTAAAARGINIQRGLRLMGALEEVAASAVVENGINLLAVPIAPGPATKALPPSVLSLLRASKAPTLLYHATDAEVLAQQANAKPIGAVPHISRGAGGPVIISPKFGASQEWGHVMLK